MPNYTYAGEVPKDDDAKKFMGASIDEGAANSFIAIKGYNLETIHGEKFVDMGVKDTDLEVAVDAVNTTLGAPAQEATVATLATAAQLPAALGKQANAASLSVTLASDEPAAYVILENRLTSMVQLYAGDPDPLGNDDITRNDGTDLTIDDFDIRDSRSYIAIAYAASGYTRINLRVELHTFDQNATIYLWGGTVDPSNWASGVRSNAQLLSYTVANGTDWRAGIGSGAVGVGGLVGGAALTGNYQYYTVPALNEGVWEYLLLEFVFAGVPTTGTLILDVTRQV